MGLFSKKNCCICDAKIGLLGGLKLKDGYLCKDCKKKLSPFFDDGKESTIEDIKKMLKDSQIDELAKKYDLRPGMGLSAIQLGIAKRYFVVVYEYEEGKFENYVVINPKIISESEEKIYVEEGEGCLSVNRPVDGIVPRSARIKVEFYDEDGKKQTLRLREELSIVFQHEIDHLNGILFIDRIDKKNPFKDADKYRPI